MSLATLLSYKYPVKPSLLLIRTASYFSTMLLIRMTRVFFQPNYWPCSKIKKGGRQSFSKSSLSPSLTDSPTMKTTGSFMSRTLLDSMNLCTHWWVGSWGAGFSEWRRVSSWNTIADQAITTKISSVNCWASKEGKLSLTFLSERKIIAAICNTGSCSKWCWMWGGGAPNANSFISMPNNANSVPSTIFN